MGTRKRVATVLTLPVLLVACSPPETLRDAGSERPNILLILSDDQRHDMLGAAGHPVLETPNLDRLAREGVRFDHAFVSNPICAASRATLFSGVHERTHGYNFGTPPLDSRFVEQSYPVLLRRAGYRTGFVGKLGVRLSEAQREQMFDSLRRIGRPYLREQPDGSTRHASEIIAERAIEFLRRQENGTPFQLSISFNAPHAEDDDRQNQYPWPESQSQRYVGTTVAPPRLAGREVFERHPDFLKASLNRERWFWRWDTPEKYQENIKGYYRMISGMDHAIGRILDELARLGLAERSIVIFSSDNGYYAGSRGFAGKWTHYDESLCVPLIVLDPRLPDVQRGQVVSELVSNVDIAATILGIAGVDIPESYQGVSLAPAVRGDRRGRTRELLFFEQRIVNPKIPRWEGTRGDRWSYARYYEREPPYEFLHDLARDPDQLENLASDPAHAGALSRMRRATEAFREGYEP